jgi:ABC-2 type transport system ATP-binding protein
MALIHNPDIFFLDEPTTGLDIQSARYVRNKINELSKNGKTIFLTTHNLNEANNLCDEVLILNRGKIVASGTPNELRNKFLPASKIRLELDTIPNKSIFKELDIDFQLDLSNKKITFYSTNPMKDFSRIQNLFLDQELKITNIEINSASLEEVFLKILGEV